MGLWLLLEIAFLQNELELALMYAAALVDPIQQAAPGEIEDLLNSALSAAQDSQIENAKDDLREALYLAGQQGFL